MASIFDSGQHGYAGPSAKPVQKITRDQHKAAQTNINQQGA